MWFKLLSQKLRKEILEAPELLRVAPQGLKLSVVTKSLLIFTLALLYSMFMYGSIRTIVTKTGPQLETFVTSFAVLAIMMTITLVFLIKIIITDKRRDLVFTEKGIVGPFSFHVKYEDIGTYSWETCSRSLALGQSSKEKNITLAITASKGLFKEYAFKNNYGGSVLGAYCYFFSVEEITKVEDILSRIDIKKV